MSVTYVYTITDASGEPLYVGHADDLFRRLRQHADRPWAVRSSRVVATVHPNKAEALRVERNLIADLEPEFNVQGNPRHLAMADLLEMAEAS